jgi:hypothetical protein
MKGCAYKHVTTITTRKCLQQAARSISQLLTNHPQLLTNHQPSLYQLTLQVQPIPPTLSTLPLVQLVDNWPTVANRSWHQSTPTCPKINKKKKSTETIHPSVSIPGLWRWLLSRNAHSRPPIALCNHTTRCRQTAIPTNYPCTLAPSM